MSNTNVVTPMVLEPMLMDELKARLEAEAYEQLETSTWSEDGKGDIGHRLFLLPCLGLVFRRRGFHAQILK